MLDIFSGLRLVVKRRNISIDNAIFRCHWFFTSTLLVSFSLVITARQYVGQPIECHSVDKISESLLNSYCWVQSTFSIPQACNNQLVGIDVPYPCIDNTKGREIKVYAYYQWVGMVLFIQGLLFHLPYYLWKVWENGLIRAITGGLRVAVLNDQERAKKKDIVIEYIYDHLGCHTKYALKYFLCEFICLVNLLLQLWGTNKFFEGQFLNYGIEVMRYSSSSISSQFMPGDIASNQRHNHNQLQHHNQTSSSIALQNNPSATRQVRQAATNQIDPMTYVFPRMTKCIYYDYGSSGDIQKHDALCLLPLNIINEKIYIALWFWFLILAFLTVLVIAYRILAICCERVRCKGLVSRCKLSNEKDIVDLCKHCDVGDWFLFYMVAENLDPLIMREVVAAIAKTIRHNLQIKAGIPTDCNPTLCDHKLDPPVAMDMWRADLLQGDTPRRNSIVDEMPFVRKIKKKLYNRRLWSIDLGQAAIRRNLYRQSSSSSDSRCRASDDADDERTTHLLVSAPPISEMPLEAKQTHAKNIQRRGSLSRMESCSSGYSSYSDDFIMEMHTITGSTVDLSRADRDLHRQSSCRGPSYPRQRGHSHHQSLLSIRNLNAPPNP